MKVVKNVEKWIFVSKKRRKIFFMNIITNVHLSLV